MLKFSNAVNNSKLRKLIPYLTRCLRGIGNYTSKPSFFTFSKLSGHSCPFAKDCFSRAIDVNGVRHIEDGKYTQFRCFSASQEVLFPGVYEQRKHNTEAMHELVIAGDYLPILQSIPNPCDVLRIHIAGDFSNQTEFDLWLHVASYRPKTLFYAYTKSLPFWIKRQSDIPNNFILTASEGGWKDGLISKYGLRYAKVVFSKYQARKLGLRIDHNDLFAANPALKDQNFALLLHGIQPKGSKAADALKRLKRNKG